MNKPPCSEWGIWEGPEIEGHSQLGEMTLFVRRGNFLPILKNRNYKRVWFCREFCDWAALHELLDSPSVDGSIFAIEVTPETLSNVPSWVFKHLEVHYKWAVDPKKGDHICLGQPFNEFSFQLDTPKASVSPDMYLGDVRLDGRYFIHYTFGANKYYRDPKAFGTRMDASNFAHDNDLARREGWVHYKIESE